MIQNETVLLTGATYGIGYELAKLFARDRNHLILVARTPTVLTKVAAELKLMNASSVVCLVKDLSKAQAAEELFDEITKRHGQVDILVNNAGFGGYGSFLQTDWHHERDMIQTNITSLVHLTKLFLPPMIQRQKGRIVNLASTAAYQPGPFMAIYYASKSFVLSFSEALYEECKGTGVTVTAICPGPTATEFQARARVQGTGTAETRNSLLKMMDAAMVARLGYKGMLAGKRVVITGVTNRFGAWCGRHLPRSLTMAAIKQLHKAKR